MEKLELINQIAYTMEHGLPEGGSRTAYCERLIDQYVTELKTSLQPSD